MEKRNGDALETLHAIAKDLKIHYNLKCSFKAYGRAEPKCIVTFNNKSFTGRGDDCIFLACKDAILYAVNTFSAFDKMKKEVNKKLGKSYCLPNTFNKGLVVSRLEPATQQY